MENILITGVSSGIGFNTANFFLEKGYFVFGSVRKQADADRVKKELGEHFHPLIFDVCNQKAIDKAAKEVENILDGKGLACLINNAGYAEIGPMKDLSVDTLHQQFDVNVYGVLRVTQAFLPFLGAQIPQKVTPGKIVNISSVSGFVTAPFLGAYAMSKYALESMSDAFRRELSIYDIDVIVIEPGAVKTEIWDKTRQVDPKYLDTDYGPILKDWDKMVEGSENNAVPPSHVAERIYKSLIQTKPPARSIVAKKKTIMKLVKHVLPDRFIDKKITQDFKKKLGIEK